MARILVFQHVAAEPLGTLDALIRARGHRARFVNFERDPGAEPSIDRYRGLVVLGGPMNVADRDSLPHLATEIAVIRQALGQGKPVLGICLGAQLLAHALGADVRHNGASEIGWHPIRATGAGVQDPVLAPLADLKKVFQWHSYTFEVPVGAELLVTGEMCRNQAFRYGNNAYGFQFHLEMDGALINRWLDLPRNQVEISRDESAQDAAFIRSQTELHVNELQRVADQVFNNFLDLIGKPARRVHHPSR